jgi:HSP20 family protein
MFAVNDLHPAVRGRDRSDMEDVFEVFFTSPSHRSRAIKMEGGIGWRPATDVYETQDEFVIQMDLAGMRREDIEVFVDEEFVVVRGTRTDIAPPGKKHFHKMEIMVGPFERHIRMPGYVDANTARAVYRSGFLFVTLCRGEGRCEERRVISIES